MDIPLTEELAPFENDLCYFVETMTRKLHVNRHKGFGSNQSLAELMSRLEDEIEELKEARHEGSQFDVSLEAVDVANFAFLIALKAWDLTKEDFENGNRGPYQASLRL